MNTTDKKLAFVQARAEGKSYSAIAKELGISKATCTKWSKDLEQEIASLKDEQLNELYQAYSMTKAARIKKLGDTISAIDDALAKKDLSEIPAEKLLDLSLKYHAALNAEYIEPVKSVDDASPDGMLEAYRELYEDAKRGTYTPAEINAQMAILEKRRKLAQVDHSLDFLESFNL